MCVCIRSPSAPHISLLLLPLIFTSSPCFLSPALFLDLEWIPPQAHMVTIKGPHLLRKSRLKFMCFSLILPSLWLLTMVRNRTTQPRQLLGICVMNCEQLFIVRASNVHWKKIERKYSFLLVSLPRLQDKVQETIEALRLAGIKVWVLTGDKHETAVSVSLSCGHFHRTMNILELLQQRSDNECAEQLRRLAKR